MTSRDVGVAYDIELSATVTQTNAWAAFGLSHDYKMVSSTAIESTQTVHILQLKMNTNIFLENINLHIAPLLTVMTVMGSVELAVHGGCKSLHASAAIFYRAMHYVHCA